MPKANIASKGGGFLHTHRVHLSGGAEVTVEEAGDGATVLLLHAGVSDRHMWDRQWEWLQHGLHVVRWDWRGFGDTPHVPGLFSYADDLIQIMDSLDVSSATLIGCSFAGSVAIQAALQHPGRVDRLVLVGSGVPGYHATNPPAVEALFQACDDAISRDDTDEALALMEQLWLIGPGRAASDVNPRYLFEARQLLRQIDRPDHGAVSRDAEWSALELLPGLDLPTLIMVGDQDVPDIVSAAHFLHDTCPQTQLEILEDAAHLPNMERAKQFDALLSDWLAATNASTGP